MGTSAQIMSFIIRDAHYRSINLDNDTYWKNSIIIRHPLINEVTLATSELFKLLDDLNICLCWLFFPN